LEIERGVVLLAAYQRIDKEVGGVHSVTLQGLQHRLAAGARERLLE